MGVVMTGCVKSSIVRGAVGMGVVMTGCVLHVAAAVRTMYSICPPLCEMHVEVQG